MSIDRMKTEAMSMDPIAAIAGSGAFAERVEAAVRASTTVAREAREP